MTAPMAPVTGSRLWTVMLFGAMPFTVDCPALVTYRNRRDGCTIVEMAPSPVGADAEGAASAPVARVIVKLDTVLAAFSV